MDEFLCISSKKCGLVEKVGLCGTVNLILRTSVGEEKVSLYMKLSGKCPRHYATLYKADDCQFKYGQFNFARCSVSRVPETNTRFHVHTFAEEKGLLFEVANPNEAENWIRALQGNRLCPYSPLNRRKSFNKYTG